MHFFRPLGDRVLVERLPEEDRVGSILLPEKAREKTNRGRVLAVGNGYAGDDGGTIPLEVLPGDEVLFGKYAGADLKLDGRPVMILREEEILARIERVGIDVAREEFRA